MNRTRISAVLSLFLVAWALLPLAPQAARAAGNPLVIIIAASTAVKDISAANLRRAFLGEAAEMGGGKRFIPLNQPPNTPGRVAFDKTILGLSADQVGAFWIDRRIRDESAPPRTVPSAELAARIVGSLPGAITYVPASLVTAQVRALTVDGKTAGQGGYVLN